jgi:site-specific DNA recombinase
LEQQRKVKTIPATLTPITATPIGENKKRRVAAYARVSTDHDEQFTSYEAQIDYYTKYIKSRSDWEFVKVYTPTKEFPAPERKPRIGFRTMIDDALAGKIDLIVTKSVSRFARNTVDSLTTIREAEGAQRRVLF